MQYKLCLCFDIVTKRTLGQAITENYLDFSILEKNTPIKINTAPAISVLVITSSKNTIPKVMLDNGTK